MGSTHFTHTTFVKGQPQWFVLEPVWATPIHCDHASMTCATDGSYTPTGGETNVNVLSDNGRMPAYRYGTFNSSTRHGVTTLTLKSGAPFTPSMVGYEIGTGATPEDTNSWSRKNVHTVRSYIDPRHITTDSFSEGDQSNAPYWFGGLWGQVGCCYTAPYDVCNVSGNNFRLRQHSNGKNCAAEPVQPFAGDGSNLYLVVNTATCYLSPKVAGLPPGSTVDWISVSGITFTSAGAPNFPLAACGGGHPWFPRITVPPSAPNGAYTITFTVSRNPDGSGAASRRGFRINVVDLPKLRAAPSSYPPLPQLAKWRDLDRRYLDHFCDKNTGGLINQGFHAVVNVSGSSVTWVGGSRFEPSVNNNVVWVNGVQLSTNAGAFVSGTRLHLPSPLGNLERVSFTWNSSWDPTLGFILGNALEPGALYYPDGILSYLFGYTYWKDPGYKACAVTIADLYARAVNRVRWQTDGTMQFQEVFGWGLYRIWALTKTPAYAAAIDNMARQHCCERGYPHQSPQLGWGGMPGFRGGGFRELILGLDLETAWEQVNQVPYRYGPVGGPNQDRQRGSPNNNVEVDRHAMLKDQVASAVLGLADYPCDGCSVSNQPFYFTYLAHALRHIDEIRRDDYVLYTARRAADWLQHWYDRQRVHGFIYNTSYNFVGCMAGLNADPRSYRFGPGTLWFPMDTDGNCGYTTGTPVYSDNSLNMAAALWSYVWKNTGIDVYRQYAYDAFAHSIDNVSCCDLNPKQFNQVFGFDGASQIALDAAPPGTEARSASGKTGQ